MTKPRRKLAAAIAVAAAIVAGLALWRGSAPPPVIAVADDPGDVPAAWREVRDSRGHQMHVTYNRVACAECHTGTGFTPPSPQTCARCHAQEPLLHPEHPLGVSSVPTCLDCHRFGARAAPSDPSRACMTCHAQPQGLAIGPVGIHAPPDDPSLAAKSPPCAACHHAHRRPTIDPPPCASCHPETAAIRHGGLGGSCLDCHSVHERSHAAADQCARCHAPTSSADRGTPRVDPTRALFDGHATCSTCHAPHRFGSDQALACRSCHQSLPLLGEATAARPGHRCVDCHDQHDARAVRSCADCHAGGTNHTGGARSAIPPAACTGCHPIHAPRLASASISAPIAASTAAAIAAPIAVACATCHLTVASHAPTAACASCHPPHGAPARRGAALCGSCHLDRARSTAATGHADCVGCHVQPGHAPKRPPPACASCHAPIAAVVASGHRECEQCHRDGEHAPRQLVACGSCHREEQRTAPAGHQDCASCHEPHGGALRPEASCQRCHADRRRGHGAPEASAAPRPSLALRGHAPLACASCHRPHGPGGPPSPPACTTCHVVAALPALHATAAHHQDCGTCHRAHEPTGRGDRATCTTCHQDRRAHEPNAASCVACHPFAP